MPGRVGTPCARSVAAEHDRRPRALCSVKVGDVPAGVARHVEHLERDAGNAEAITVEQRHAGLRKALSGRSVHHTFQQRTQRTDAAYVVVVVGVVVGH